MTRRHAVLAIVLAAVPGSTAAQGVSALELRTVVERLVVAASSIDVPRLRAAVQWLRNNRERSDLARLTVEYVRSLDRVAALLEQRPGPPIVDDLTRELEAKVEHCRRLGVGMGGTVSLLVNTRRRGTAVPDWQVLYLLKFDEWLKTPPRVFPRVSSPTDARVEPGRYWLWARDPATGAISERTLVEVAGVTTLAVDVPVP